MRALRGSRKGNIVANSSSGESMTERIVRVLSAFNEERTAQTAAEIGRRAGLPSSTAHRIVDDLVESGLLERDSRGYVVLGMRLWELAQRGSRALRLREAALPSMEKVQARVREHTQLAVLEDDAVLILERLSHASAGLNLARVAGRLPLHASSSGLILLAHAPLDVRERVLSGPLEALTPSTIVDPVRLGVLLDRVKARGFVVAPGMLSSVSTGVAVPVRSRGRVVAALSVVLPRESQQVNAAVEVLGGGATAIASALAAPSEL